MKSTVFIASSIAIIDIKLIPIAVLKEWPELIPCNLRITVSSKMLVIRPLIMASAMICIGAHPQPKV